jgi:uncharacterized delta-60 repeat protein
MDAGRTRSAAALAALAILAVLVQAAPAAARPGALDRGFNGDGKVVTVFPRDEARGASINYSLPYEFAPGRIAMAAAGGGKIVAASSKALVEYLANGRRNPRFGGNGAVPIDSAQGFRFQLADVAVDPRGRVLVAGTTKPTTEIGMPGLELAGPLPTVATILRYRRNGQLDPTFGIGGVLNTTIGAPPPTLGGRAYPAPAVAVVGLAVDRASRPIVTGSAVVEVGRCPSTGDRYERSRALVARLTEGGAPDLSFAGSGTKLLGGLSWLGFPSPRSGGVLSVGADANPCPVGGPEHVEQPSVLTSMGEDGSPSGGFGAAGLWSRPYTRVSGLAVAPGGKIVLLIRTIELSHGKWVESAARVARLRRNGAFDRSFGRRGEAELKLPRRRSIAAIATDARGRVLIAGAVKRKPRREKRGHRKRRRAHLSFLLVRTTAAGRMDRSFGHRGRVATSFGAKSNVRATEVLVGPGNRIAVGGRLSRPRGGNVFALARYLGGR